MKYSKQVVIRIGDTEMVATVEVDLPQAALDAHVDPRMILETLASGQNRTYVSRHHEDRNVRCEVPAPAKSAQRRIIPLRRVA